MSPKEHRPASDGLMTWAVRASDLRTPVHVAMLGGSEVGAKCGCICPSCRQPLLAINVGKPPSHFELPGTQRKHFKHEHTGQEKCLSGVSKIIALQLYVDQDVVDLPPRRRRIPSTLPTGEVVYVDQELPGERVPVIRRTWIDDVSALLELPDGRTLVVTVRTKQQIYDSGESRCVLSLADVNDPGIASWDTQQILEHLRLPGCGIDWGSHWQDVQLDARLPEDISATADQYLDGIPAEYLAGLDGKQASETILHWLIKKALSSTGVIRVPEYTVPVSMDMPDGGAQTDVAVCPGFDLYIEDVRLEKAFDSMVPDVMCVARRGSPVADAVPFMFEAAVTNYLSYEKKQKIIDAKVGCIQIRADLFPMAHKVKSKEIVSLIQGTAVAKQWIVHPWMQPEIARARRRLHDRSVAIQRAMNARAAQEQARQLAEQRRLQAEQRLQRDQRKHESWLKSTSKHLLVKGFIKAVQSEWSGNPAMVGTYAVTSESIALELVARCILPATWRYLTYRDGLLSHILRIRDGSDSQAIGDAIAVLAASAYSYSWQSEPQAVTLLLAIERYRPHMSELQLATHSRAAAAIRASVNQGQSKFLRSTACDDFLMVAFPEMVTDLQSPYATEQDQVRIVKEREDKAQAERRRQATRAARVAKRDRLKAERELRKKTTEQAEVQRLVSEALDSYTGRVRWTGPLRPESDAMILYSKFGGKFFLQQPSSMQVIKVALQCRALRYPIDATLRFIRFQEPNDVHLAVGLLMHAGLIACD